MRKLLDFIKPPQEWKIPVLILSGVFAGIAIYSFIISNAVSYISDKPETCINCHIMMPEYATYRHSSHQRISNCNDCHVPHNNIFNKYFFKAKDGLRHATIFTLRAEPQVIYIKEAGINVVQENCKRCHQFLNEKVKTLGVTGINYHTGNGKLCWECHREVPHGRIRSLSSAPNAMRQAENYPIPVWLKLLLDKEKK
jgi:cytochrome c nitrite reductase small subunit